MKHLFDVNIATEIGIEGAIILEMFSFLIMKLKANEECFHDGHTWLRNSRKALSKLFPYMSGDKIRRVTDRLVDQGYLITDNTSSGSDRTLSYALPNEDVIWQSCQIHLANLPNPIGNPAKCTPYIYKDKLLLDKYNNNKSLSKSLSMSRFEEFWKLYPRKTAKAPAKKKWEALVKNKEATEEQMITALQAQLKGWEGKDLQYIPYASTWLNQKRFEDVVLSGGGPSTSDSRDELIKQKMQEVLSGRS